MSKLDQISQTMPSKSCVGNELVRSMLVSPPPPVSAYKFGTKNIIYA